MLQVPIVAQSLLTPTSQRMFSFLAGKNSGGGVWPRVIGPTLQLFTPHSRPSHALYTYLIRNRNPC